MNTNPPYGIVSRRRFKRIAFSVSAFLTFAMLSAPSYALRFGSEESGITGSFDSVISYGLTQRASSSDCRVIGNDNGGCNRGANNDLMNYHTARGGTGYADADINYINSDDGNLNYKKGDIVSQVLKGTHELSLKMDGGWSALGRITWSKDFSARHTQRTDLDREARDEVESHVELLDLWVAKRFELAGRDVKLKLGNQVVSWGEDLFIIGGINQINAINLGAYNTPGTQLKEVFIPAQMLSFSAAVSDNISIDGYYQFKWNSFKLDPVGTYFSGSDLVGTGKRPLYYPTSVVGAGDCAMLTPLGRCGEPSSSGWDDATLIAHGIAIPFEGEHKARNSGQFGLAMHFSAPEIDTDFALYYQRYHDKLPFLGFSGNLAGGLPTATGYSLNYGEDKDLFGASLSTKVGPVAVGAEISYRPRDSIQIDPTVPFGSVATGIFDPNSVYDMGFHKGFVEEKKWQMNVTGLYGFSHNDPLGWIARALGASDGLILGEVAVAHYPDLDLSGAIPYALSNYNLPDRTSWGYVLEASLNYPNVFDTGVTVTPQITWAHDVHGTTPNALPFVEGRKAITLSLLFNYRDQWHGGVQYVQFRGGGDNNLMLGRDFISSSISYSF